MTTAAEMIEMLRAHYIAPSKPAAGYFCPEIQAPEGNRRADLIWLPLTSYQRGEIIGHEVKVSRADVIQELSDPTKADAWAQYCTQWWLVVSDPALVEGLEVPARWGILAPPSGRRTRTMTVLRDAQRLTPVHQATALATIMARMFNAGDDVAARMRIMQDRAERAEQAARGWEQNYHDASNKLRTMQVSPSDAEIIQEVLRVFHRKKFTLERDRYLSVGADAIAATLIDIAVARARAAELARDVKDRIGNLDRALREPDIVRLRSGLEKIRQAADELSSAPLFDLDDAGVTS